MLELTARGVAVALLAYCEENYGWASYGEFLNYNTVVKGSQFVIPGLGPVTIVDYHDYDSDKNYDGWTEEMWIVFEVQGKMYKASGTYTSYVGSDWNDELKLVQPKTKQVTYFEEVQ